MNERTKEQEILMIMRKVLGKIVRETTPQPGMKHPLSDQSIENIRNCFGLISAREKELAEVMGLDQEIPYFTDDPLQSKVVPISKISRRHTTKSED